MILVVLGCAEGVEEVKPLPRGREHCEGMDVFVEEPIYMDRVERAVDLYRGIGFEVGEIHRWTDPDWMPDGGFYLFVDSPYVLRMGEYLGRPIAALTEIEDGLCLMIFDKGFASEDIVRHEFGHALGYMHVPVKGHVMNLTPNRRGPHPSTTGMIPGEKP